MARDEFWTNQDRQCALLDREANRGWTRPTRTARRDMGTYGNTWLNTAVGAGDTRASGIMGSGNAWAGAMSNAGNAAGAPVCMARHGQAGRRRRRTGRRACPVCSPCDHSPASK
jgi:hypothetical protein